MYGVGAAGQQELQLLSVNNSLELQLHSCKTAVNAVPRLFSVLQT